MMNNKVVLIITDGIGYNQNCQNNAFYEAQKPTYDFLFKNTPNSLIKTSGLSVGLPDGQMGNSEVGHMCIGSGRVLYQDLVKISLALKDGSLEKNRVLNEAFAKSDHVHLIGLLSDGGVHSHIEHTIGLALIAKKNGKKVYLHLITDGRDVSPTSSKTYIKQIREIVDEDIKIASISGRFYAMDRDNRWDRIKEAYSAIVDATIPTNLTIEEYIDFEYDRGITDEFIEPVCFDEYKGIQNGDVVILTNFRSDRMREIATALGKKGFNEFKREYKDPYMITMTNYDASFNYPILFDKNIPKNTLAETISKAGLSQLHTAETEKYAHVTFFLNGGIEKPYKKEDRVLIPSPKIKTYDLQPQMSAPEVGKVVRDGMDKGYDFIVVNFANGDMVGHTGNFQAAIKAVEAVDKELGLILKKAKEKNYSLVITSDHGNCEQMRDNDGNILTNHTTFDVFCFVVDDKVKNIKNGGLNNIAPTVLKLMGLKIPKEMDEALF